MALDMAMARYKELCIDTTSTDGSLGRFWAAATGVPYEPGREPGDAGDVVDDLEHHGIAMCPVPEPRSVKHRVHLDVCAGSVQELVDLGGTVLSAAEETGLGWTVMADPEGGELCCFVREEPPAWRLHGIVVDSLDPERQATWWGRVYGVTPQRLEHDGEVWWSLEHTTPDEVLSVDLVPVPEPKTVKNRIHWDVYGDPAELEAHGATRLRTLPEWTVMADPEGNEFCVFAP